MPSSVNELGRRSSHRKRWSGSQGVAVSSKNIQATLGGASLSARKMVQLVYQTTEKRASGPKCPVTGKRIQGIPHLIPTQYKRSRLARNRRTVNRPYGGVLPGSVVPERIIRAFLIEAQKIVKKVLKIQKDKDKQVGMS